jgi:hypothetical protein
MSSVARTLGSWVRITLKTWMSVCAATSGLLYKPQMIDEGDCGAIGGIKIGMGNRSTRRKPARAPLCPPQIPHDQTRVRTRAAAMGSQRLTVWAMARPYMCVYAVYVVPCVGSGLATGWSLVQGVLPSMYRIKKLNKKRPTSTRTVEP